MQNTPHFAHLLGDISSSWLAIAVLVLLIPGAAMILFGIVAWFRSPSAVSPMRSCVGCGRHFPQSSESCPACGDKVK
jgi:hypothetical protein